MDQTGGSHAGKTQIWGLLHRDVPLPQVVSDDFHAGQLHIRDINECTQPCTEANGSEHRVDTAREIVLKRSERTPSRTEGRPERRYKLRTSPSASVHTEPKGPKVAKESSGDGVESTSERAVLPYTSAKVRRVGSNGSW